MKLPFVKGELFPVRDGYGKALLALGESNPKIVVLDADLAASTRSNWFADRYPERFIDVGIAEQNMTGVAAGLSLSGKIPFVTTYGAFVTGRAFDQIRNTVSYSNLNVKIVGSHGGLSVGPDGGSHQAIEDIALMNLLPNLKIFCPVDANEAWQMTLAAAEIEGPVYIRLAREATEIITGEDYQFEAGRAAMLSAGDDGIIIFHSVIGSEVSKAATLLAGQGLNLSLINFSTIKPLDTSMLDYIAASEKPLFVIEEHLTNGGLTSIIATYFSLRRPIKFHTISIADCFGESGSPEALYDKFGFSAKKIANYIIKAMNL
jgi:transketolase